MVALFYSFYRIKFYRIKSVFCRISLLQIGGKGAIIVLDQEKESCYE